MQQRDVNPAEASLELLLDTICNAFGGILFLTILVAMLLRLSSPRVDLQGVTSDARHELVQQEKRLSESLASLDSLRETLHVQRTTQQVLIDPGLEDRYREWNEQRSRLEQMRRDILEITRSLATTQEALDRIDDKRRQITKQRLKLEEDIARLRNDIGQTIRRNSKTIQPARTRSTVKGEFPLVVRYDRAYVVFHESAHGLFRSLNTNDFVIVDEEGGSQISTPKPYRGLALRENPSVGRDLRLLLQGHDPRNEYIAIAIWEDSFDSFSDLRDVCIENGFEYRIIPVTTDSILRFGPVDNPQVQ
jgi:hypothetical protein